MNKAIEKVPREIRISSRALKNPSALLRGFCIQERGEFIRLRGWMRKPSAVIRGGLWVRAPRRDQRS